MDVQMLGPLRVLCDGVELDLGRPKQRLLFAVLVTAGGETVSVDRLVDELWGDDPPPRVASSLQAYVSKLRQVLEPDRAARSAPRVLVTRAPGYALVLEPLQLDANRFAREADEVRRLLQADRFERAYDLAGVALARWSGDLLADLADEPVAQRERPRWQELRLAVTEDRLQAAVELGLHATAIADLEQVLAEHPLRERALGLLLRALYLGGRPVEALERYRAYRTRLQDELGLDPGNGLRALEAAILQQDPALLPAAPAVSVPDPPAAPAPAGPPGSDGATLVGEVRTDEGGRAAIVGRDAELTVASRLLEDVRAGRTRWLTVAGEPGIGKTRLTEALAERARALGVEVSWGRCHEDDDAPAYWPWSQLLRPLTPGDADPIDELLASGELPLDPDARRYRLHERVGEIALADGARVLIVDDAQWADPASLQLLEFLAVQVREGRLGMVLTVRTGVERPHLRGTLAAIARHPGSERLELAPLGPEDLAELAAGVTGTRLEPSEAVELHERTAGNPFFATEVLRLPAPRDGDAEPPLPAAVRDVIERRLVPLGEDARSALDVAAVVGTSFDLTLLEGASGMDPDRLFDAIDLAVATGLVVTVEGAAGGFRFAHALVRDALLADLSPLRRQRLHARIAEALEHRPRPDPARQIAELAHHRVGASAMVGLGPAHDAVEAAARAAEGRLAFDEAAAWWRTGSGLLERHGGGPADVDRDLVAAGRALLFAGRTQEGREALRTVMDRALARSDATAAASAGIALGEAGGAWYWVDPGESPADLVRRLEATLEVLGTADHPLRVHLLGVLATGVYYADPVRAASLVREGLEMARRLDDPYVLAVGLLNAMGCEWDPTTGARHLELSGELLRLPDEARPPVVEVAGRLWRANVYAERAERRPLEQELATVAAVADASSLQVLRTQVAIARVGEAWLLGDLARVDAAIDVAAELHERSGLYRADAVRLANRFIVRLLQGRLAEVADELSEVADVGFGPRLIQAYAELGRGDRQRAVASLAEEEEVPRQGTWQWLPAKVLRSLAVLEAEAAELAGPVRAALTPHADSVLVAGTCMTILGPVGLHAGALAALEGELEVAETHLRAALDRSGQVGSPIWGALAEVRLGEVLLRQGRAPEAAQLLRSGARNAQQAGLGPAAARAEGHLETMGASHAG
jgi:DNA-binding SARP family transcriptional activator